jgi:hypothetical protein
VGKLLKSKTFWAGVAAIVAGVQGIFLGDISLDASVQLIATGLIGIFLRDGIRKI